jgi:FkbM family methyltransferase
MEDGKRDSWLALLSRRLATIDYYRRVAGRRGAAAAIRGKLSGSQSVLKLTKAELRDPFFLRVPSSDVQAFEQIFIRQDYAFNVTAPPATIVDAGANIGLASLYFSNRFPASRIIAIEPERSNFALLRKNVAGYANITPVQGALWHENKPINLVDPDLGEWGFMTQSVDDVDTHLGESMYEVPGMTVDTIMKEHGLERIDILKIDIEGAEREVFSDPSVWLGEVDALIVELHERLKPGCNRSFYNATAGFDDEWFQGENVYLTRRQGCVTRSLRA